MKTPDFTSILIFTDGACTGNPGPGGWGAIVVSPDGHVRELGAGTRETTNNRMELAGALHALKSLAPDGPPITLYTDSTYVIRGITQWIWGWRSRGWRNAEGKEVLNRDLWEELLRAVMRLKPTPIEWKYVRGHTGVPGNERCDEIAVGFANGKYVSLYDGPLLGYGIAIHDLPDDQPLPEMKTYDKATKKAAHSYLSYFGGVVMRHKSWAGCERRVKGQSQAKFKKAMSAGDEASILKSWGLNPSTTIVEE